MRRIYRKVKVERTGYRVQTEGLYMGGNYRSSAAGGGGANSGGSGTNGAGNGAPTGTAAEGSIYIQKDSIPAGLIWEYYNGSWH